MSELPSKGPLLAPGDEPPGGWTEDVNHGGTRVWKGESYWRTQHGPAIVQWNLGRPSYAWDVLTHDGARNLLMSRWPASDTFRFVLDDIVVHGTLDIRANDVVFMPVAEQPTLEVKEEHQQLFDLLANDALVTRDLQDRVNAQSLYGLLENGVLRRGEQTFEFGSRSAAHFVAALRGNGEDYLDYAWHQYGSPSEEGTRAMRAHFERLNITGAEADPS
jgi:hypothetical protein